MLYHDDESEFIQKQPVFALVKSWIEPIQVVIEDKAAGIENVMKKDVDDNTIDNGGMEDGASNADDKVEEQTNSKIHGKLRTNVPRIKSLIGIVALKHICLTTKEIWTLMMLMILHPSDQNSLKTSKPHCLIIKESISSNTETDFKN